METYSRQPELAQALTAVEVRSLVHNIVNLLRSGLERSEFPMAQGAVMGTTEVLLALPRLALRMLQLRRAVKAFAPDVLLTVDGKGFNFRFLRWLSMPGNAPPRRLHVVAPSDWAFRSPRALLGLGCGSDHDSPKKDFSGILDELLCVLPFEPGWFGSRSTFVGHPALEEFYE